MPRKKDPVDVSTIVQAVRSHANGAEFADILAAFAQRLERHKLQRWLDDLRARGTILTKGTKPLKYFVAEGFEPPAASADLPGKATADDMPGNDPGDPGRSPMPGNAGEPDMPATRAGYPGIARAPRNDGEPDLGGKTGAGDMPVTRPMNPGTSDLPATSAPKPGMPGNGAIMSQPLPAAMPGNTAGANLPATPANPGKPDVPATFTGHPGMPGNGSHGDMPGNADASGMPGNVTASPGKLKMPGNVPAGSMPATVSMNPGKSDLPGIIGEPNLPATPGNPGKSDLPAISETNAGSSGMPAKPGDANMPGNAGQPNMASKSPGNPGKSELSTAARANPGMSKMPGNVSSGNLPTTSPANPGKSDMPATSPADPGKAGGHPGRKRTAGRRDMPGKSGAASSAESSVVTDGDSSPEASVDEAAKLIAVFDRFRSPGAAQAKRLVRAVWEWVGRVVPGGQNPLTRGAVCVAVVAAGLYLPSWIHLHGGAVFLSALATAVVAIVVAWVRQGSVAQPASAGTSVAPPAPPSRFASRKSRTTLVAAVLAIVVLTLGVFWYLRVRSRPSEPDIGAWVLSNVAPLPVRITALTTTYVSSNRSTGRATYDAVLELTAPLYEHVDTAEYLRGQAGLAGITGDGSRSGPPEPANLQPSNLQLWKIASPPGTIASTSGTLLASRTDDGWRFKIENGAIAPPRFRGEPKPAGAAVFVIDDPVDVARLKTLLAERAAAAAKAQAAAQTVTDSLVRMIQRGAWFVGTVTDDAGRDRHGVLFEVTECSTTTHQISLDLRNDQRIWTNTRQFTGDWRLSADGDSCTVNLRSSGGNGFRNRGAVLDDESTLYVTLQLWPDRTLTATPRTWQLQAVAANDVAATKSQFGYDAAAAPSVPGSTLTAPQPSTGQTTSAPAHADVGPRLRVPPTASAPSLNPHLSTLNSSTPPPPTISPPSSAGGSASAPSLNHPSSAEPTPGRHPSTLNSSSVSSLNSQPSTLNSLIPPSTFPSGAYVLIGDRWEPLPHNNGRLVQSAEQAELLLALMAGDEKPAASHAGSNTNSTTADGTPTLIGQLAFNDEAPPPTASAANLTLVYVDRTTSAAPALNASSVADPPAGKQPSMVSSSSQIELAPLKTGRRDVRTCPLYFITSGVLGFGPNRIPATIEMPSEKVRILHLAAPLKPGRYALSCGSLEHTYELLVK